MLEIFELLLYLTLNPAEVYFSQDSIAGCFKNKNEINRLCEEIAKEYGKIESIPKIRVVQIEEIYYR